MWRIQAKHETVCPRCKGYIKKGAWIVLEDGNTRYSHAVCPSDVQDRKVQAKAEPTTYIEFAPNENGNLIEVERTLE